MANAELTNSLDIAARFGRTHKDVLRIIDRLRENFGKEFGGFTSSSYRSKQNKKLRAYDLTPEASSLVVMGFTGAAATKWKSASLRIGAPIREVNYESELRAKFYKDLESLLPGAVFLKKEISQSLRPDGFVLWRGREAPAEVKRYEFNDAALDQLRRYMAYYGSKLGIAVAPRRACVIPRNIKFVAVQYDHAVATQ